MVLPSFLWTCETSGRSWIAPKKSGRCPVNLSKPHAFIGGKVHSIQDLTAKNLRFYTNILSVLEWCSLRLYETHIRTPSVSVVVVFIRS